MKKIFAILFALVMVLGIIAGIAAPVFAEEDPVVTETPPETEYENPAPAAYSEPGYIIFYGGMTVVFGQPVSPAAEFVSGYAELMFDGVSAGYVAYYSHYGDVTVVGTWYMTYQNAAYRFNACLHWFSVEGETSSCNTLYFVRMDENNLVGGMYMGIRKADDGTLVWGDNVRQVADADGVFISGDTDLAAAWEYYAVAHGREEWITVGTTSTTFTPERTVGRAEAVTMLWRAMGSQEPEITTEMPFIDVGEDAYYYTAVLWAYENGITAGTAPDHFSPYKTCTRGEMATFAYRAKALMQGEQPYSNSTWTVYFVGCEEDSECIWERNEFLDITCDRFYCEAVNWSLLDVPVFSTGITPNRFGPNEGCTRALALLYAEAVLVS